MKLNMNGKENDNRHKKPGKTVTKKSIGEIDLKVQFQRKGRVAAIQVDEQE